MRTTRVHDLRLKAKYSAAQGSFADPELRQQALDLAARCELLAQRSKASSSRVRPRPP